MSRFITSRQIAAAIAGACALAMLSLPATALAGRPQSLNRPSPAQAGAQQFGYHAEQPESAARPLPKSNSFAARARRLLSGKDGPLMHCDQYGYRCDPNPAYYGDSAYNHQPYPYYSYADGYAQYSFPNVPLMGGL